MNMKISRLCTSNSVSFLLERRSKARDSFVGRIPRPTLISLAFLPLLLSMEFTGLINRASIVWVMVHSRYVTDQENENSPRALRHESSQRPPRNYCDNKRRRLWASITPPLFIHSNIFHLTRVQQPDGLTPRIKHPPSLLRNTILLSFLTNFFTRNER